MRQTGVNFREIHLATPKRVQREGGAWLVVRQSTQPLMREQSVAGRAWEPY
jgi:hypothetical protein